MQIGWTKKNESRRNAGRIAWGQIPGSIIVNTVYLQPLKRIEQMQAIRMVDLQTQYHHIKEEIDSEIAEVLESSRFIGGEKVANFASRLASYYNSKHIVTCANGTDALQIALMALRLNPGDEIITPSFTYVSTTEVVALLGLKPVFVDVDKKTFCLDPAEVRKAITPKTRAIVPVHIYGHAAPMAEIMEIARENNLFVVEDNAQATGCDYIFPDGTTKKTGSIGDIGCTSFFPSKTLGCYGDGGAIATNDEELAIRLKMIANHGQRVRYYHEMVGCNSRLDAIQAAVLNVKLPHLDRYIDARRKAADYYDQAFAHHPKITTPFRAAYSKHVFYQYTLILEGVDRDGLMKYLEEKNIPSQIAYPLPVHRQKAYRKLYGSNRELQVTDWLTSRIVSLPMHTELKKEQQDYIIENVLNFIDKS